MSFISTKNKLFYLMFANILSIIISGATLLIFPKTLSIVDFGFWQLYMLFNMYFSYATFGLADGVYVRYSEKINSEKKMYIGIQYWFMVFVDFIVILGILWLIEDSKKTLFILSGLSCLLVAPKAIIVYHLQSIGNTNETSRLIIIEKIIFIIILAFELILKSKIDLYNIIYADLFSKIIPLVILFKNHKEKFLFKNIEISKVISEIKNNFTVGVSILLINSSSILIIGVFRISIEQKWGIEDFSKISLMINLSNFLMIFISSFSLIVFPFLKNRNIDEYFTIYDKFNKLLFFVLINVFFMYYPVLFLINKYLPEYKTGIEYFPLLLSLIIFDGKVLILTANFLKIYRREKSIFIYNILIIVFTFILYLVIIKFIENILFVIIFMAFTIFLKSLILEMELKRVFNQKNYKSILYEFLIVTILVISLMKISNLNYSVLIILLINFSYFIVNRKKIKEARKMLM